MNIIKPLDPALLRVEIKSRDLGFKTTQSLKPLNEFLGQERAIKALLFGVDIQSQGYNLYAMGPTGLGKRSVVNAILTEHARRLPTPPDICYIYHFADPEHPIAVTLPAGKGIKFQKDMSDFVNELGSIILTVLESDVYRAKAKKIHDYFESKRHRLDNKPMKKALDKTPELYKAQHLKEARLQTQAITSRLKIYMHKLKYKYIKNKTILQYLRAVSKDVIEHVNEYVHQDSKTKMYRYISDHPNLNNYKVNLLVNNAKLKGAPVVFEDSPTYSTLISRLEHRTVDGVLVTDFTLIKAGALHNANGGFLIIEARKIKNNMEAWEALKNALYSKQIEIKIIGSNSIKPVSLRPLPVPLNVKVILIGDRNNYYSLSQYDSDFSKLFKVPVDFDEEIDRNKRNVQLYSRLVATIIDRKDLLPFDAAAVAAVINYSSRITEDRHKLSTYFSEIEDVIIESSYWATVRKKKLVTALDVKRALDERVARMDRAQKIYYENIERDYIIIKTKGGAVGQINCLSVRRVANFSYGHPTRVTARVHMGKGKLIDIQREIKLSGPMHNKAGLIISNFLASQFNPGRPFAMHASIAFEQVYCWTDGDSASVGELCALISAITKIPLSQSFAITGSIDQHGMVQAVGGLNEKIEGFFDICMQDGLTGKQGVIIPKVNIKNLMLRKDIQAAAAEGKFHIYPINNIDEAIQLLTGMEAGKRDENGLYPDNSVYAQVEMKLRSF